MSATIFVCEGTPEYEEKLRGLKVQPEEARRILADHIRNVSQNRDSRLRLAVGSRIALVGDAYHFHLPRQGGCAPCGPFAGYYVHGQTGRVELRPGGQPRNRQQEPEQARMRAVPTSFGHSPGQA